MGFVLKLLVSMALVGWILSGLDGSALLATLSRANGAALLAATIGVLALALVQAARWRWVLHRLGGSAGYGDALINVLIGQFFNQTLPSTVGGDAMRIWLLRSHGMGLGLALNSVLIDRLVALGALLLLGLLGVPWLAAMDPDGAAAWAVGGASVLGSAALASVMVMDHLPGRLLRWRPLQLMATLSAQARQVVVDRRVGPSTLAASLFIHTSLALIVYLIARALGIEVSAWHCLVLVPPVMVASAIPVSVAGWGVREGAMVAALALVDVTQEAAFALSVLFGLCIVVAGLPGGLLWLLGRQGRARPAD